MCCPLFVCGRIGRLRTPGSVGIREGNDYASCKCNNDRNVRRHIWKPCVVVNMDGDFHACSNSEIGAPREGNYIDDEVVLLGSREPRTDGDVHSVALRRPKDELRGLHGDPIRVLLVDVGLKGTCSVCLVEYL